MKKSYISPAVEIADVEVQQQMMNTSPGIGITDKEAEEGARANYYDDEKFGDIWGNDL